MKAPPPENYRGMLALLRYDDGTEKCVGCDLCETACPSRVIGSSAVKCRENRRSGTPKNTIWI